ncbi:MAG: putative lipoic acid-binding regulatory protein [Flavobacteriales bacterium]|jgi:putative lipoic acid-binding regulatory protein
MSQQEPPKIEFPCADYPIKVMGESSDSYRDAVFEVVEKHAPGFDRASLRSRESGKGTFVSLTILITATGVEQLHALHMELKAMSTTRLVL